MKKKKRRRNRKTNFKKVGVILIIIILTIVTVGLGIIFRLDGYYLKYLKGNNHKNIPYKAMKKSLIELEKEVNIQPVEYDWKSPLSYDNDPNKIIVHHTVGSDLTPQQIHNDHQKREYDGIGYHYYIRKDGTIYKGRPDGAQGAHTIGENRKSLGVCLEGDFDKQKLMKEQEDSLKLLCEYLIVKYNLETIIGHRDAYNTLCPGKNISLEDLNEEVGKGLINLGQEYK